MGVVNLFYMAWRNSHGDLESDYLGGLDYHTRSGSLRHIGIMKRRQRKVRKEERALSQTTHKSKDVDEFLRYTKAWADRKDAFWKSYGDKRNKRSEMVRYIQKRGTVDRFLRSCKTKVLSSRGGETSNVRWLCGIPTYRCTAGGRTAVPTSWAYRRLAAVAHTVPVDEYMTSQICYNCDKKLSPPKFRNDEGKLREVRGIRLCNSRVCRELHNHHPPHAWEPSKWMNNVRYNRDKVGAANILRCGGLSNYERPLPLQRPSR